MMSTIIMYRVQREYAGMGAGALQVIYVSPLSRLIYSIIVKAQSCLELFERLHFIHAKHVACTHPERRREEVERCQKCREVQPLRRSRKQRLVHHNDANRRTEIEDHESSRLKPVPATTRTTWCSNRTLNLSLCGMNVKFQAS